MNSPRSESAVLDLPLQGVEKRAVEDLALLGGSPAFAAKLHVGRPELGNRARLMERIEAILDRNHLTNAGPTVREFERRAAEIIGVEHCIALCNGTVALEIAIRALGLRGEVIVPSLTFIATAHALQWQGITPVFADVDPATHNLDPEKVASMITPNTSGVIGVHLWGRPCPVEELSDLCRRRGLGLMFDAAHAFGCTHRGRMVGGFGQAEVFSFHATKFVHSFEGGLIATRDAGLARKIRLMKNFGFEDLDRVIYIGTNGKMSEISAAMGLTSLEAMEQTIAVNRRNYWLYRAGLDGLPGVRFISHDAGEQRNFQHAVLEYRPPEGGLSRDQLVALLRAENVLARRYFYPGCHRMEPYRSYFPHAGLLLPETEKLAARLVVLPTGSQIGEAGITRIAGLIRLAIDRGPAIREALEAREARRG